MEWQKFERAEKDTIVPALICVVDELAEFLGDTSTRDRKKRDNMDRFDQALIQIARLGRAAHIHLLLATQTPSANLFSTDLKSNLGYRFICGYVDANISRMAIDSESGTSLPSDKKGMYLGWVGSKECNFQGYYTSQKEVLASGTVRTEEEMEQIAAEAERVAQEIERIKSGESAKEEVSEETGVDETDAEKENDFSSKLDFGNPNVPTETETPSPTEVETLVEEPTITVSAIKINLAPQENTEVKHTHRKVVM